MKILKINPNKPEKEFIKLAAEILKSGGIVIYPTDTVYGIAASALDRSAIHKVYQTKGRDFNKPISVAFSSLEQAMDYVVFNSLALEIAKKFLPGPLTMVLPMKYKFPKELTPFSDVGVRIPDSKIVHDLIDECGFPITSTSANISGDADSTSISEIDEIVANKIDLILDGGRCKLKKPSTVIKVTGEKFEILREGAISEKELLE